MLRITGDSLWAVWSMWLSIGWLPTVVKYGGHYSLDNMATEDQGAEEMRDDRSEKHVAVSLSVRIVVFTTS